VSSYRGGGGEKLRPFVRTTGRKRAVALGGMDRGKQLMPYQKRKRKSKKGHLATAWKEREHKREI